MSQSIVMKPLPTAALLGAPVLTEAGATAGSIEELILDPASGVVRFARLRTTEKTLVLLPWAALVYQSNDDNHFRLTALGEGLVGTT